MTLDDLDRGDPSQRGPLRPSWCYGTPGLTRAQQLTALALGDTTRQRLAESAIVACLNDPTQIGQLADRSLCHGTAGLLTTARRIAVDALTPIPLAPLQRLHQQAPGAAGEPAGFLDGTSGAALATFETTETSWDACLLLC
ncbi:lanthionine synthetase LanC family protein [Micromonospora sp. NPDC049101]|uniref:lanthionine synthetase LanC family protein n=1 Tax=Micromonospora sp. NPDC049101 TaxID=3155032 RepID=UPI0033C89842